MTNPHLHTLEPRRLLAATYDWQDFGIAVEPQGEAARDINNAGYILGQSSLWQFRKGKAYRTDLASRSAVGVALTPDVKPSMAGAIQNSTTHLTQAAVFNHGARDKIRHTLVDPLPPGGNSIARAVNDASQVVGQSDFITSNVQTHAFLAVARHSGASIVDLNDYRPIHQRTLELSTAVAINDAGQILAQGVKPLDVLGAAPVLIKLSPHHVDYLVLPPPSPKAQFLQAADLNNAGQAVGSAWVDEAHHAHAVLWKISRKGVTSKDLGAANFTQSRALAINDSGYIVGELEDHKGKTHGFVFDPNRNKLLDLNTLISGSNLTITRAAAINAAGQIAAEALDPAGQLHVVLLTPQSVIRTRSGVTVKAQYATIYGSHRDDEISISDDPADPLLLQISINSKTTSLPIDTLSDITVLAGDGNDRITLGQVSRNIRFTLNGEAGNDRIHTESSNRTAGLSGGAGNDLLVANPTLDNVSVSGDSGNDTLIGGAGFDRLLGGFGDDSLVGGDGRNVLAGESGNDTMTAGNGVDSITGGQGDDFISSGAHVDEIDAGTGNDTINAGDGDDNVFAGPGDDLVFAGSGDDFVYGQSGNDTLQGQSGDDTLGGDDGMTLSQIPLPTQNPGNDFLDGGKGNDYLVGSRESLTFVDDNGQDTLTGGPGGDVINARGNDIATDATPNDIIPAQRTTGQGPFAVQQTATLSVNIPAVLKGRNKNERRPIPLGIPAGAGHFANSPFYADADGTLHMQDTVNRKFYLAEFFQNWGIPVDSHHFGAFYHVTVTINGTKRTTPFNKITVSPNDTITLTI